MDKKILILLSFSVLSVTLLIACGNREPAEESTTKTQQEPETVLARKAPEFKLNSFDGRTISLSDYKGKIVVLEWFNYECPFVLRHYGNKSTMIGLANKYSDSNVTWFAINSTNHATPEANIEFARKRNLSYPILDDRSGTVGRAYGAKTTPQIYVIDTRGGIAYQGAVDNNETGKKTQGIINYVDKVLAELTAGKKVSITDTMPYGCTVKYAQ